MRMAAITGLLLALTQTPHGGAPPMPYIDQGACPFECCTYRDWVAEAGFQAVEFWMADGARKRKPTFKIAKGERVTAMSGVVLTTQPGVVRVVRDGEIDVSSKLLPKLPAEKVRLTAGEHVYIFTNQGEGYVSGWFKGRVLESFDTFGFAPAADCDKLKGGCVGIVERLPESEWWVKIRNRQGAIGWVLVPKGFKAPSFDKMDRCG